MRYFLLLIFVPPALLGTAGALFTYNKLERMEQIRGWKPGAEVRMETVRQKYENPDSGTCWVAFTDENIRRVGPHRMNMEREPWSSLNIGDVVEVVYLPGDPERYSRDGIYANDGNFAFDWGLLVIEVSMVVVSALGALATLGAFLFLPRFRKRTAQPQVKRGR